MKACLLFIHLISSFLSDSTLFLRDIFLKYSFSCLFMGKSTWFTVQTSSDVQGLGMFLYCILTLRLLVYWESISRMTTMTTALITARPPTGFSWFIFFSHLSLPFWSGFMNIEAADSWVELVGFCTPYLVKTLNCVWFGGWKRSEKIYSCVR